MPQTPLPGEVAFLPRATMRALAQACQTHDQRVAITVAHKGEINGFITGMIEDSIVFTAAGAGSRIIPWHAICMIEML